MADFDFFVANTGYALVTIKVPDDDDPAQMMLLDDVLAVDLGTPQGFFANTDTSTSVSPHTDFNAADLEYTGTPGKWFRKLEATKLTNAARTTYFANGKMFLIVTMPSASRQVSEGSFTEIRRAA